MNNKPSKTTQIPEEALKLLPWYATGWLSPKERSYIKGVLKEHPELQELLVKEQKIISLIKEDKSILDKSSIETTEARLSKVLLKLDDHKNSPSFKKQSTNGFDLGEFIKSFFFGSKIQYISIALISTISIALLYAFISPLVQQNNAYYPAALEEVNPQSKNVTILLVGLNVKPNNASLLKVLNESQATISAVPGKDAMFKVHLKNKLDPMQTKVLLKKLSSHTDLFWFVGEAY